jgi:hypothetical protein
MLMLALLVVVVGCPNGLEWPWPSTISPPPPLAAVDAAVLGAGASGRLTPLRLITRDGGGAGALVADSCCFLASSIMMTSCVTSRAAACLCCFV